MCCKTIKQECAYADVATNFLFSYNRPLIYVIGKNKVALMILDHQDEKVRNNRENRDANLETINC